ncbi:unnamed protein product [Protopolystoma xenopodis]|uniref:Uncharacterized protein n=1 Tax=Protopolystoma xenopodis TaxID=117903 RepID=A0A448XAF0_9PLAT|nr:unnamed protein product [Protopolystoma xenopodis]
MLTAMSPSSPTWTLSSRTTMASSKTTSSIRHPLSVTSISCHLAIWIPLVSLQHK